MRNAVAAGLTALALVACGGPSATGPEVPAETGPEVPAATSLPPEVPEADPGSESSSPAPGDEVYYLHAEPGCYSFTAEPTYDALIEGIGKSVFAQDCDDPHHFEVFWAGIEPGFDAEANLQQGDAGLICGREYRRVFGVAAPRELLSLEEQYRTPNLYWFFPDDGLEALADPGRIVCTVFISDDAYTRALSHTGRLTTGAVA